MDSPPCGPVRTSPTRPTREDESPCETVTDSPRADRPEGNSPKKEALNPSPTWTTLEDDVRLEVLSHLDLVECSHVAASSRDGRRLVDRQPTGVPTVPEAQTMLAAPAPRDAASRKAKTATQATSRETSRALAAAVAPLAEGQRPGPTSDEHEAMAAARVPEGSASKVIAASDQPADRIAMRPLALVQANLLGWADLRQVLRHEDRSAQAKQTSCSRALRLYAVEKIATKVLGASFITRSDANLRRAQQRRDYPYVGSPACKRICAKSTVFAGVIIYAASLYAARRPPDSLWIGTCCLSGGTISILAVLTGMACLERMRVAGEHRADSWMTEAVGARDMGSKAHREMCEEFHQASRGLQAQLENLAAILADIVLRRIDHLNLDNAKIGQRTGVVGDGRDWQRCCEVCIDKCHEVSACLEELHQFSIAKVQPLFAWLRHLRVLFPVQANGSHNYFSEEDALARSWQNKLPASLAHVSDSVALLRLQFKLISNGDSGEDGHRAAAADARLQTARDAWAEMVTSLYAEVLVVPAASMAEAADR